MSAGGPSLVEHAPAKINLCLFLGPTRDDGRHELVTVMEPLELADLVTLETLPAGADADEVVCPGVEGPNLAAEALARFRAATGWEGTRVRLSIDKRIPVAAGMAGGSADAGAALRLASRASGLGDDALLHAIATGLGADVPAQVRPRRVLATGAGERLVTLPGPAEPYGVLVLPAAEGLSTGAVFMEADRLGLPRDAAGLAAALAEVEAAASSGVPPPVNELAVAARALSPAAIDAATGQARAAGAEQVLVSGSGPTVLGLFATPAAAQRAAVALGDRRPAPIATRPLAPTGQRAVGRSGHNEGRA